MENKGNEENERYERNNEIRKIKGREGDEK